LKEATFMERAKNKNLIGLFILGAVMLFLPVLSEAAPPKDAPGTHVFCGGAVTISANLGRTQPLRVHGTCSDNISISDTRVNITILGDGGDVLKYGSACLDPNNTKIVGADPTAGAVIDIRGHNITITGVEILGLSVLDPSVKPPVDPAYFFPGTCAGSAGSKIGDDSNCNASRGVRIQRGGTVQLGRNVGDTAEPAPHPTVWDEQTGICVHHVAKRGVETTGQAFLRITNSEIHHTGGDAISVSEGSAAEIGFASGGDFQNLFNTSFIGPGRSGPNFIHDGLAAGINVQFGSQARIYGNTIATNKKDGVTITGGSNAEVADNLINANANAISVADGSNLNLGTVTTFGVTPPGDCDPITSGHLCTGPSLGTVNISSLVNSVSVANKSGGIKCGDGKATGAGSIGGNSKFGRNGDSSKVKGVDFSISFNQGGTGNLISTSCNATALTQ
jgi:hypothetical protein